MRLRNGYMCLSKWVLDHLCFQSVQNIWLYYSSRGLCSFQCKLTPEPAMACRGDVFPHGFCLVSALVCLICFCSICYILSIEKMECEEKQVCMNIVGMNKVVKHSYIHTYILTVLSGEWMVCVTGALIIRVYTYTCHFPDNYWDPTCANNNSCAGMNCRW